MRVLVLGGTRFLGAEIAARLVAGRHDVTLLNRGTREGPLGTRVTRLVADRTAPGALARAVGTRTFDAVIDMCAYTAADAEGAVEALAGRTAHYVLVSTGQVYLVRDRAPWPSREGDYDGPTTPAPTTPHDLEEWRYGMGKRGAEDVLAASVRLPATRVRIPMVHGPGDHHRRIEGYLWRLLDGGPILLPDGGSGPARHVWSTAVARAIIAMLGDARAIGGAFNLAQDEVTTVRDLVQRIAEAAGGAPGLVAVPRARIAEAGLIDEAVSPLGGAWMSCIDPSRAKVELGFQHEPAAAWLPALVTSTLASLVAPPPGYARRADELRLARGSDR